MRSVKSFVPTIVDQVKGDQLCIPAGINYELSYYYGAAVPDISNPRCSLSDRDAARVGRNDARLSGAAQAPRKVQSDRWRRPSRAI